MSSKDQQSEGIFEAPEPVIDPADELDGEIDPIDLVLTKHAVSVSEFKKNPNAVVASMHKRGLAQLAVMTNNKATFYVLTPARFDDLLEQEWEHANETAILAESAVSTARPEDLVDLSEQDASFVRQLQAEVHSDVQAPVR